MSNDGMEKYFFRASAQDFSKMPGNSLVYWASKATASLFEKPSMSNYYEIREGLGTRDDDIFLRRFWEVSWDKFSNTGSEKKWIKTDKAGQFRKWYGNFYYVMNWESDGYAIKNHRNPDGSLKSRPQNTQFFFKEAISWNKVGSGITSFRWRDSTFAFNDAAPSIFGENLFSVIGMLNSTLFKHLLSFQGGTLNVTTGIIKSLPLLSAKEASCISKLCVNFQRLDWDSYETSWDFTSLPLLDADYRQATLAATYENLRSHWQENTLEMQRLEEENNRIFIEVYELENELTPDVPLEEITLTCNPYYRYRLGKTWEDKTQEERTAELEIRLKQDTMKEFISYAVGCMFGRYSLDKEGLVLANQGETLEDYLVQVPNPSFMPDKDNVIPMLDDDWFTDDIAERFKSFLKKTFGEEHYEENLNFIENALNVRSRRNYSIRDYFLREFYNDHVGMYKKRPIYWLFSSPKGSFNALIYMHRYRSDTVSVVLNKYLREYQSKLASHKTHLEAISIGDGSQTEKTRALKEIERINKVLHELEEYEREVLYPLATEQVVIDLDDGVKQNYPKFGKALKKVTGL